MSNTLNSMTGFARSEASTSIGTLCWELRSVNHRYLDVQLRLPESLRSLEHELRTIVGKKLGRGKIDCTFSLRHDSDRAPAIDLDIGLLRSLRDAARTAESVYGELEAPTALDLLRWPGVIGEQKLDSSQLNSEIVDCLNAALVALCQMRAREGEHLAETLKIRCQELSRLADEIAGRRPEVIAAIRQRLADKLAKLEHEADPARLETELVILAQKLDVDEELDRLAGHLKEMQGIIAAGGPCGRKLDFLIQELNREANTLASKASDGQTTRASVAMKVAIEQMREQVQNIE